MANEKKITRRYNHSLGTKAQIKAKNQKPKHRNSKAIQTGNKASIKTEQ